MNRALVVLVVVLAASSVRASPHVTDVLGAASDVHAVLVDDGAILLGTSAGVVVVRDGQVTQTIATRDGLVGSRVLSLSRTGDGVWVGGADGLALLASGGAGYRVVRTQPIRRVTRVAELGGTTYFATFGDGLLRAPSAGKLEHVAIGRDRTRVTDLVVTGDRLWIATADDGVIRLAMTGRRDEVHGLPSDVVWDLEADGDSVLAATAAGVAAISPGGRARVVAGLDEVPVRDVRAIAHAGAVTWIATFGAGAWRIEGGHARRIDATPETRALAVVDAHAIVGSARGATSDGTPLLASSGLPSPDVTALASAMGALWVGSFSGGVARVRDGVVDVPAELAAIDPRINDLAVTHEPADRLWIATDRGLWSYDGRSATRESQIGDEHVGALHVAADGTLWVAASHSILHREAHDWRTFTGDVDAPLSHVDAIASDRAGRIWAAGLYGVVELATDGDTSTAHTAASGALAVDWATSVVAWQGGVVIGTYDAGLSWFDGAFHLERDLPRGWINAHAMRVVGDDLWVGTLDGGLLIGRRGAWQRLRIADGLPGDDVTALLSAGPRAMWVGTRAGVARVEW
jgi:ligand-binding sensor domain-containing protein